MAILILELETIIPPGLRGRLKSLLSKLTNICRAFMEGAAIHIQEVGAAVENHVPLIGTTSRITAVAEVIAISQIIASLVARWRLMLR